MTQRDQDLSTRRMDTHSVGFLFKLMVYSKHLKLIIKEYHKLKGDATASLRSLTAMIGQVFNLDL